MGHQPKPCEWCDEGFVPYRKTQRFCSHTCSNRHQCSLRPKRSEIKTGTCEICDVDFTYKVYASSKKKIRTTCSVSCGTKALRRRENPACVIAGIHEFTCNNPDCTKQFKRQFRTKQILKIQNGKKVFCSKRCSAVVDRQSHRNKEWYLNKWTHEFGPDEAQRRWDQHIRGLKERSSGENNAMYGKPRPHSVRKKVSAGVKQAYKDGRLEVNFDSWGTVNTYRGIRLRSMLERNSIIKLEKKFGLTLGIDLLYEDKDVVIEWINELGEKHVYKPDLFDTKNDVVYEVKVHKSMRRDHQNCLTKAYHAMNELIKRRIKFKFVTESAIVTLMPDRS